LCTRRSVNFYGRHGALSANNCKTAAVLALTEVRSEDKSEFSKLIQAIKEGYSDKNEESKKQWGGGIMGAKANARTAKKRKALESAIKI
jgi:large subunit ribosomal protein L7Ae